MATRSNTVTVTAPTLRAVWIHDPADPEGTSRVFLHGSGGRQSTRTVNGESITLAGRELPLFDFGEHSTEEVSVPLLVLYGETWQADLAFLSALVESRTPHVYRDDRGRLLYGVAFELPSVDEPYGTAVELRLEATNFNEEVGPGFVATTAATQTEE